MPAALLGQPRPQEAKEENQEYTSAFLVLIGKDGSYELDTNINRPVTIDRAPTPHEVEGSLAVLLSDVQTQKTSVLSMQLILSNLMAQAAQMRDAQMNAQVMQQIGTKK